MEKRGPWTIVDRQRRYDNRWIEVTHHDVITPAGQSGIYGTVHFKNTAIGIVPIDAQGYTRLVGQYRFPLDAYSWEIPEGGGPLGTDPAAGAARELKEETGLVARQWRKLIECDLSNSVSDEASVSYLAWDLIEGAAEPEPTEVLQVRRLPLTEAFAMVANGDIRDALSVISLQTVQILRTQNLLPCKTV